MTTSTDLEKRLLALDMELHSILDIVKEQKVKELGKDVVEDSAGAWGYNVESAEFVEGLRKSRRLARFLKRQDFIKFTYHLIPFH